MTTDIAILQHAHKQPLYGFLKKHAQFFKSQKYTLGWLNFTKTFYRINPFEEVNPDQIRSDNTNFRNLRKIKNTLTRFQIYPETELACKYKKPIYKTQYSEILVEYEHGFDMNTGHLIVAPWPHHIHLPTETLMFH